MPTLSSPPDSRLGAGSPFSQRSAPSSARLSQVVDSRGSHKTVEQPAHRAQTPLNVFLVLIALRVVNALSIRTFFQPDEYFQSLEPAWQLVFGSNQGAWLTWEWTHQLRSSLHPFLFAAVYSLANSIAGFFYLTAATRAELLVAAPKTAQAVIAALQDFYTWKLAGRVYGNDSNEAWATLALTILSPWQWFCSTRTFSNCLETTLTVAALYFWPWQLLKHSTDTVRLRQSLTLAALACVLRPTNVLVWATLAGFLLARSNWSLRLIMIQEASFCGSAVLAVSAIADRAFYGVWSLPSLNFLYFNVAQSLAVFYGCNDWHYYLSQGYPLLLTTALPFTIVGMYRSLAMPGVFATDRLRTRICAELTAVCLVMPFFLSLISHKEVRFIYPLLPPLHVLTAPSLVAFFLPAVARLWHGKSYLARKFVLFVLFSVNIAIAFYTSFYHASGTLNVLSYLRQQHQSHAPDGEPGITAGFLMPCHSTPWRSHMVYPTIRAWALTCEPPIGLNETEKAVYLDEADQFYDQPEEFLRRHMKGGLRRFPRKPTSSVSSAFGVPRDSQFERGKGSTAASSDPYAHEWPDYLIFFAQLEPTLHTLLRGSSYAECWRTWNTAWHDDWRRRGDIVVWCLDKAEHRAWQTAAEENEAAQLTMKWRPRADKPGRISERIRSLWRTGHAADKRGTQSFLSSLYKTEFLQRITSGVFAEPKQSKKKKGSGDRSRQSGEDLWS